MTFNVHKVNYVNMVLLYNVSHASKIKKWFCGSVLMEKVLRVRVRAGHRGPFFLKVVCNYVGFLYVPVSSHRPKHEVFEEEVIRKDKQLQNEKRHEE